MNNLRKLAFVVVYGSLILVLWPVAVLGFLAAAVSQSASVGWEAFHYYLRWGKI